MRHGVKTVKFKGGKDANDMLMRKLAANFLLHGKMKTTLSKAKMVRPVVEKLVSKARVRNEANKNYLLRRLNDRAIVEKLFDNIGPAVSKINGGYVRIVRLGARLSDGSEVARLEWVYPIVNETPASVKPARPADGITESKSETAKTAKTEEVKPKAKTKIKIK